MAGVGCGGYVDRQAQKLGLITVEDAQKVMRKRMLVVLTVL